MPLIPMDASRDLRAIITDGKVELFFRPTPHCPKCLARCDSMAWIDDASRRLLCLPDTTPGMRACAKITNGIQSIQFRCWRCGLDFALEFDRIEVVNNRPRAEGEFLDFIDEIADWPGNIPPR